MVDLSSLKIELKAKNSSPIAPSDTNGGNISHRDKKQNDLVDFLQTEITNLSSRISTLESSSDSSDSSDGSSSSEETPAYSVTENYDTGYNLVETAVGDENISKIHVTGLSDITNINFAIAGTPIYGGVPFEIDGKVEIGFDPTQFWADEDDLEAFTNSGTETGITIEVFTV